ncbi:hypothetical protein SAMN05444339_11048 [Loktanella atrilutea]|uniref:Bacteriophage holin of superfamily 6 (Holin_LLH) n=1 Tax=Loktanella atrilutea TaxID=366533 RepID=A0A1M5DM33_LOKAT|nr:hypothetical protein [Loktanella atrilutea]SHF67832.1 hypothetical protein SAMN05444339_11048 [Loktanella atrilutea]
MDIKDLLADPAFIAWVVGLLFSGVMAVVAWAQAKAGTKNKLEADDIRINRIKDGITNVVTAAMADGHVTVEELVVLAGRYVATEYAQSKAKVLPSPRAIETIVKAAKAAQAVTAVAAQR